jgi:hypothetical protein
MASRQRDFLLSLAVERLYRPAWSAAILAELHLHETLKLAERGALQADAEHRAAHLVTQMRAAFADAEVTGWERLEGAYGLPDPNDEHVVAAAVVAGGRRHRDFNVKDFPSARIPRGREVLSPEEFAFNTVLLDPGRALIAVEQIATRSGRYGRRLGIDDILELLAPRYDMEAAVSVLKNVR